MIVTCIEEMKQQQAQIWDQYQALTCQAERLTNEVGYGTAKEAKEIAKEYGVAYKNKQQAASAIYDAYLEKHNAADLFVQYEELGIAIMEMEEQTIQEETQVEAQPSTPVVEETTPEPVIEKPAKIAAEQKLETRMQFAMDHLQIHEDLGIYATCPSTSGKLEVYVIDIDETTFYSIKCSCPAKGDCLHRTICDQKLADRRPSFKEQCKPYMEAPTSALSEELAANDKKFVDYRQEFYQWKQQAEADAMDAEYVQTQGHRNSCIICGRECPQVMCNRCLGQRQ